jgi:hypothetical protein
MIALPYPLVQAARMAELLVTALFGDPPLVEHHDLVNLVETVAFVGDEQDTTAFGGLEQVRGQRLAAARV